MITFDVVTEEKVVAVRHPVLTNLYGRRIGPGTRIGTFVEIQKNFRPIRTDVGAP